MSTHLKRRVAFALLMGVVTTGIISFVLVVLHAGLSAASFLAWLRAWGLAYVVVVPVILLVGPPLQAQVDRRVS